MIKVTTLDISPCGGILVTGSDDGVARLWKYSEGEAIGLSKLHLRRDLEPELEGLRGVLSPQEWDKMEKVATHLLCRLEGHLASVTDTLFSSHGDRVLTGSLSDGTVRIWSFGSDYKQHEHVWLRYKQKQIIQRLRLLLLQAVVAQ